MAGLQAYYLKMQMAHEPEIMLRWLQVTAYQSLGIEFPEDL